MSLTRRIDRFGLAVAALALALSPAVASAQSVQTITDIWGGSNNGAAGCGATFGPSPDLVPFFGGGGFRALGGNTNCGYSGSATNDTSATGPLTTTRTLAPVPLGNPLNPYGSFSGDVTARADYGSLGASVDARLVDSSVNTDAVNTAAAALFDDFVTATSPLVSNGTAGFVRYVFDIDGSLTTPAAPVAFHGGFASFELEYQHAGGSIYRDAYLSTYAGSGGVFSAIDVVTNGFAFGPGTISGSAQVRSFLHPIVWGQAWELRVGVLAQGIGDATADFLNTGQIGDIELYDAAGQRIAGATVRGASGRTYVGPAAAVPEPATWALFVGGFGLAGMVSRRQRRLA